MLTARRSPTRSEGGQPRPAPATGRQPSRTLKTHFGRIDPAWGEVNRIIRGKVDLAIDGGPDTYRAVYGGPQADGRLKADGRRHPDHVRHLGQGRAACRRESIHQFGSATLDPHSPHYADQTPLFVAMKTKPVLFTEGQLAGHVNEDYAPGQRRAPTVNAGRDEAQPISRRQVAAAVAGNALEFYDFTTYAYFAVQIGHAFFPGHSAFLSLILSLATFGAGFLLRPLGRLDARPGTPTVTAAAGDDRQLRPDGRGHRRTGGDARLRGMGRRRADPGGDVPADPGVRARRRGRADHRLPDRGGAAGAARPLRRLAGRSQNLAAIAGGDVGVLLTAMLGEAALDAWGWRLAFALGALILPVGPAPAPRSARDPASAGGGHRPSAGARHAAAAHVGRSRSGLALIASMTVSTYAMTYMTIYARETLRLGAAVSLAAPIVNGAAGAAAGLLGGWLSDRFGRRPFLIWPRVAFLLALWPAYRPDGGAPGRGDPVHRHPRPRRA